MMNSIIPSPQGWLALRLGFTSLQSQPGGLALDFIRGNLFDRTRMKPLPYNRPGPDNDLNDTFDRYVLRAMGEEEAVIYAFGERWGPEANQKDKYFGFKPGNGIHDIHMNQANSDAFRDDDGVWQDGAVMIQFPSRSQWVAIFLKFQSQSWHSDDRTGHRIEGVQPDHTVRIIAALVNPPGPSPEKETVTLLNTTPQPINLNGWAIADKLKHKHVLGGSLEPGGTIQIALPQGVQLGNDGGIITLLDTQGLKVHGVSYTKEHAQREGWTIVF